MDKKKRKKAHQHAIPNEEVTALIAKEVRRIDVDAFEAECRNVLELEKKGKLYPADDVLADLETAESQDGKETK
ncbi:MAG: hypothetical protein L0215_23835 [Gemmataceae bacterium]|nr:hypothetical protein [Gemmataceae bacterium]